MTEKISYSKASRILALYIQGCSQSDIARKLGVDQSTVSLYANKYKTIAGNKGLETLATEYGMTNQFQLLHSLAVELKSAELTVEETKAGVMIHKLLQKYGIREGNYDDAVRVFTKIGTDGFLNAAIKLVQMEKTTGLTFEALVSQYQAMSTELERMQKELTKVTTGLKESKTALTEFDRKRKLADEEMKSYMDRLGLDKRRLQLVETLAVTLKKAKLDDNQLDNNIKRLQKLAEADISLDIFDEIIKKDKVLTADDQGQKLFEMLSTYGNLTETINALHTKILGLEKQAAGFEEKITLKTET